jgi:heptosyltransferase-2
MPNATEKILVRGVNWLGDAVMSTPALQRLRAARPAAEIVLLTPAKLEGLWTGHPAINRALTFAPGDSVLRVARRLRPETFSTALIFPNSPRSALAVFLAGIPRRIGHARPWRRWLLTQAVAPRSGEIRMHKRTPAEVRALIAPTKQPGSPAIPPPPQAHHIHQYLHLVSTLGADPTPLPPFINVTEAELAAIRQRFAGETPSPAGTTRPLVIGINPGAEYGPAKRWPTERFVAAVVELGRRCDAHFWVLGGPGDRALADAVVQGARAGGLANHRLRSLAGETSLRELCAALKACAVVLTNDTGPMHLAAAVGSTVVVPFGSTSWRLTGPGLPGDSRHRFLEANVPCAPCFRRECPIDFRCMHQLGVDQIVQAVFAALPPEFAAPAPWTAAT